MLGVHFASSPSESVDLINNNGSTIIDESIKLSSTDETSSYTSYSQNPNDAKLSILRRSNDKQVGLSRLKTKYQVKLATFIFVVPLMKNIILYNLFFLVE